MTIAYDTWNLSARHCTCRTGRDHDGAEFGLCEFCERAMDDDARLRTLARDAARWRISQYPGCFKAGGDRVYVGIQPHPVTNATSLNQCTMGRGETYAKAIDGMFASLAAYDAEGSPIPADLLDIMALFNEAAS